MHTELQVLDDIDNEKCWKCRKDEMCLDEEGGLHQGFTCKSCGAEVIITYKRVMVYPIVLCDSEADEEIEVYK
jgi:hypothetical protein